MVLTSVAVHLLVVVLLSGFLLPGFHREKRPVYYVDLLNLPVKAPQAGRPEARKPPPAKEQKTQPARAEPAPPQPAKALPPPEPAAKAKPAPEPAKTVTKAATKAVPKPEPKAAPKPPPSYNEAVDAIEKMRRQQEREALKQKLAALATADTRKESPISEAPVGMPEGKGNEAGVSEQAWIQAFLKENWSLSKYQVVSRNLESTVLLIYGADGTLLDYQVKRPSRDLNFDESVKKAILKEKKLPFKPDRRLEIEVVFNLKDLME